MFVTRMLCSLALRERAGVRAVSIGSTLPTALTLSKKVLKKWGRHGWYGQSYHLLCLYLSIRISSIPCVDLPYDFISPLVQGERGGNTYSREGSVRAMLSSGERLRIP